jgi:hypothetical protein
VSQIEVTERAAAAPVLPAAAERAEEALAEGAYLLGLAAPYIPVADLPRLAASAPPAAPGSP